jgi:acetyl-CoA acetyltransferase
MSAVRGSDRSVWLVDTEVSAFGRHTGHGLVDCAGVAVHSLVARHAAVDRVQSLWLGSARPGESDGWESGLGVAVARAAGLGGEQRSIAATDVRAFCASSNVAFVHAASEVRAGRVDVAVAAGVEHMSSYAASGPLRPPALPEWAAQMSPPVFYALCASRYLADYDLDAAVLADVAVRNRAAAVDNPRARFRAAVTREEVLGSRMIAEPLTLLQCSAPGDGAGAALLVSEEGAEALDIDLTSCVRVAGWGYRSAPEVARPDLTSFPEDALAAGDALAEAGIRAADLDVLEVHDAFSIAQVIHLEDLNVTPRGEGWRATSDGPSVNPSGGLLGRSHPLGATGIAQLDSVRRALRGQARHGLVQEAGGLTHLGQLLSTAIVLSSS